jgi:hypothetical protein
MASRVREAFAATEAPAQASEQGSPYRPMLDGERERERERDAADARARESRTSRLPARSAPRTPSRSCR